MASGVNPDSTEDPDGQGAPEMPPLPDELDVGFLSERYWSFTQRPLSWYDTYRNPLVTVAVTDSFAPAFTSPTTDAFSAASVRTFRSVVAYLLSTTLSRGDGVIVSDADLVGFGAARLRIGARAMCRLTSWPRASATPTVESIDEVEAGAGYATRAPSPGMTALATPTPKAVSNAAGTTTRASRTAKGGRIARLGRGRATS